MKLFIPALAVLVMVSGLSNSARAQQPGSLPFAEVPAQRPTVSPYLNLLQSNGTGIPNYQTLVRPAEQDRQNQIQQQVQIQQLQRQVSAARVTSLSQDANRIRSTGHETRFMNYSHYFTQSAARPAAR